MPATAPALRSPPPLRADDALPAGKYGELLDCDTEGDALLELKVSALGDGGAELDGDGSPEAVGKREAAALLVAEALPLGDALSLDEIASVLDTRAEAESDNELLVLGDAEAAREGALDCDCETDALADGVTGALTLALCE